MSLQALVHYSLHFFAPGLLAFVFFRPKWKKVWAIMILTMLVDLDHLFSNPIFDPNRCSIGYHPLHTFWAMAVYAALLLLHPLRPAALGLLFHMFTDYQDCLWQ